MSMEFSLICNKILHKITKRKMSFFTNPDENAKKCRPRNRLFPQAVSEKG